MNALNNFFWYCAGVHRETLVNQPTEQNKYLGIGATIFFTGLFAALSGGYAMYFVFKGDALAIFFSIFFGLIWGLAIFNMDRYIVSSIDKNGSTTKQFLQATPRILLAIMIGIVISRPLELKIFDKEIKDRLALSYLNAQRAKIDTLNAAFDNKYKIENNNLQYIKTQRDSLAAKIKSDEQKLNFEIFGNKTNETSGVQGYGPYAKRKEQEIAQLKVQLDTLNAQINRGDSFFADRKNFDGLMSEKILTSKQLDSLANVAGFADRNWALNQLKYGIDGKEDSSTSNAILFIGFLFIFFECLPVFVKLMSKKGPYDHSLLNQETLSVFTSDKDLEAGISVINETHDFRVQEDIKVKNHKIRKKADWDLDN